MASLELKGSSKYLTTDPAKYFEVKSGNVDIYVTKLIAGELGRSIFLCNLGEGAKIPPLALANENDAYTFMLQGAHEAVLDVMEPDDGDVIREGFLNGLPDLKDSSERFSIRILDWYNDILSKESGVIEEIKNAKTEAGEEKERLFSSMFGKKKGFYYESVSSSTLYNAISIYCDYLKINVCPYRMIQADYGDDFTVEDVARMSHFVVRRVTLQEKWYKKDMGAFLGFLKRMAPPLFAFLVVRVGSLCMISNEKRAR